MSVILTGTNIKNNCVECNSINCHLPYPKNSYKDTVKKKYRAQRHEECPLKSVEGLIEQFTFNSYTRNEIETIIKEYCEVE